jgi:hypothetical protein
MPISIEQLAATYPRLYHMAAAGSWPSIEKHGLLSTSALLELFQVSEPPRSALESQHRPETVEITHPVHGRAEIRDQKPMSDGGLVRALPGDISPREWYELLNEKVFFWVSTRRLETLMNAKAYRKTRHTVLTVDTKPLVERHAAKIVLCPINSGCTKPMPHPRDRTAFLSLDQYPFEQWKKKRGVSEAVVELAVVGGVPDIREFVLAVDEAGAGLPAVRLYEKSE